MSREALKKQKMIDYVLNGSFEEQFPSLKARDYPGHELGCSPVVEVSNIKMYCLDKQKVREAIEKLTDNLHALREEFWLNCCAGFDAEQTSRIEKGIDDSMFETIAQTRKIMEEELGL